MEPISPGRSKIDEKPTTRMTADKYIAERARLEDKVVIANESLQSANTLYQACQFFLEELLEVSYLTIGIVLLSIAPFMVAGEGRFFNVISATMCLDLFGLVVYYSMHRLRGYGEMRSKYTLLMVYEIACFVVLFVYACIVPVRWIFYFSSRQLSSWIVNGITTMLFTLAIYKTCIAVNLHQKRNKARLDAAEMHLLLLSEPSL